MKVSALGVIACAIVSALAHGGVNEYTIDGKWYEIPNPPPSTADYSPRQPQIQREWRSNFPVTDMQSPALVCNNPGTIASKSADAKPGSSVSVFYRGWPHNTGAVIVWMANCGGSCRRFNGAGNHWFKIAQAGLLSGTISDGWWAQRQLQADGGVWNTTIPARLKPGNYLIRHELISLHVPYVPEFYPECAHLRISGNGTETPGPEFIASIPGVYQKDNSDLVNDVWNETVCDKTSWPIPGPSVWRGSGN